VQILLPKKIFFQNIHKFKHKRKKVIHLGPLQYYLRFIFNILNLKVRE